MHIHIKFNTCEALHADRSVSYKLNSKEQFSKKEWYITYLTLSIF